MEGDLKLTERLKDQLLWVMERALEGQFNAARLHLSNAFTYLDVLETKRVGEQR